MGRRFLRVIILGDLLALAVALVAAIKGVYGAVPPRPWQLPPGATLWPFVGLLVLGALVGSYLNHRSWAKSAPRPSYGRALAVVATAVAITAVGLVSTRVYWSRQLLVTTAVLWLGLALAHRLAHRQRPWEEPMVVITGEKQLAEHLRDAPHTNVLAVLDPGELPPEEPFVEGVTVVVDLRAVLGDEMARFVSSLNLAGYSIRPLVEVYEEHTGRIPMVHLAEGWELTRPVDRSAYEPVKRVIDVVGTVVTAPVWLVVGLVVWTVVKLDSPGPAIFRQERVGRHGKRFVLYKFRTMVHDAEANGPQFAAIGDPRVTPVGRFLRKSRLDEIPQLWNVLKGDLSIVGPRPERPVFVERFQETIPFYGTRHLIRPGVTGWAQVNYGYADDEADTVEKLTYDLYYVKHASLWLDLQILGRSIWTVLTGFGAR